MSAFDKILFGGVAIWLGACALFIWGWTFWQAYRAMTRRK